MLYTCCPPKTRIIKWNVPIRHVIYHTGIVQLICIKKQTTKRTNNTITICILCNYRSMGYNMYKNGINGSWTGSYGHNHIFVFIYCIIYMFSRGYRILPGFCQVPRGFSKAVDLRGMLGLVRLGGSPGGFKPSPLDPPLMLSPKTKIIQWNVPIRHV